MRAKNEYKFLEEAYTQVNEGLDKRYQLKSVGGQHSEQESVVGEFDTIDEVIDFIDLPEEYGSEWTVDIRDNREWSSEGFQDGLSHFGIGEIFDVVDTQPDPLDDHSSVEAYRAARGIPMPEDQEYDKEEDYWTPEVKPDIRGLKNIPALPDDHPLSDKSEKEAREFAQRAIKTDDEETTHKPYVSSYMPFHRDEDDKLKPSKKIFAVLDKHGNAVFTSNSKLEAYKWFKTNYDNI